MRLKKPHLRICLAVFLTSLSLVFPLLLSSTAKADFTLEPDTRRTPPLAKRYRDGAAKTARFYQPRGIAVDGEGNVYVADTGNHVIRKITPQGVVSTLAGKAGTTGSQDGKGSEARFSGPWSLALDKSGNLFVTDGLVEDVWSIEAMVYRRKGKGNQTIRKITPEGVVTTIAGGGRLGQGHRDGRGVEATFSGLSGIAVDKNGVLFVTEVDGYVRKIRQDGTVSTLVRPGNLLGIIQDPNRSDGPLYNTPQAIAVDNAGVLYVAGARLFEHEGRGYEEGFVRKILPDGSISEFAGQDLEGDDDGSLKDATFNNPVAIAVDSGNIVLLAGDYLRVIDKFGMVTSMTGIPARNDLLIDKVAYGNAAGINIYERRILVVGDAGGFAIDNKGNIFVSNVEENYLLLINPGGDIHPFAGRP